jgi:DNA-binding IscR family transcriptional regulator
MEALDQSPARDSCLLTGRPCTHESSCAVHDRWAPTRQAYLDLLRRTTIAELVDGHGAEEVAR